jgi:hypothetical protein
MALDKRRAAGGYAAGGSGRRGWRHRLVRPLTPSVAWVARLAAGILLGLTARALAPHQSSEASYRLDPPRYLKTMKTLETEDVCTQVYNEPGSPAIDPGVAIARVNDTLYGHPGQSWDKVGSDRIFFTGQDVDCQHAAKAYEIYYEVRPVTECPGDTTGQVSCAVWIGPDSNTEFDSYDVELYTPLLINPNMYQFVVNHETGHVFGLADQPDGPPPSSCPGDSIMNYKPPCPNPPTNATTYPWPTSEDKSTVVDIMGPFPASGSGSGSGSGRVIPL